MANILEKISAQFPDVHVDHSPLTLLQFCLNDEGVQNLLKSQTWVMVEMKDCDGEDEYHLIPFGEEDMHVAVSCSCKWSRFWRLSDKDTVVHSRKVYKLTAPAHRGTG